MSTTIAAVSADENIGGLRGNVLATLKNRDFIVVAGFPAIGGLLRIGLTDRAVLFSLVS